MLEKSCFKPQMYIFNPDSCWISSGTFPHSFVVTLKQSTAIMETAIESYYGNTDLYNQIKLKTKNNFGKFNISKAKQLSTYWNYRLRNTLYDTSTLIVYLKICKGLMNPNSFSSFLPTQNKNWPRDI
jgi:hypothetical protein